MKKSVKNQEEPEIECQKINSCSAAVTLWNSYGNKAACRVFKHEKDSMMDDLVDNHYTNNFGTLS